MKKYKPKAVSPIKPRTAYNLYLKERWKESDLRRNQERIKDFAKEWKKMTTEQKKKYQDLAQNDKERHRGELRKLSKEAVLTTLWVAKKAPRIRMKIKLKRPKNAFMLYYED